MKLQMDQSFENENKVSGNETWDFCKLSNYGRIRMGRKVWK
jgi:hypothetical protein